MKTESSTAWEELFEDIQQRGVEEDLLSVVDSLIGLTEYDRQAVLNDSKLIHQTASKADADQVLTDFISKWQKVYP